MKKHIKEYEHESQKFNTCVELNYRNLGAHQIITRFNESGQIFSNIVYSESLEKCIKEQYDNAIDVINRKLSENAPKQKALLELGFIPE